MAVKVQVTRLQLEVYLKDIKEQTGEELTVPQFITGKRGRNWRAISVSIGAAGSWASQEARRVWEVTFPEDSDGMDFLLRYSDVSLADLGLGSDD